MREAEDRVHNTKQELKDLEAQNARLVTENSDLIKQLKELKH